MGIEIGTFVIPYYGLFIVLGITAASLLGKKIVKLYELKFEDFITLASCAGLGGMIGAKGLYFAVNLKRIDLAQLHGLKDIGQFMGSGFVFYGGLIGGLIALNLGALIFDIQLQKYLTVCIPCLPIAHAFGRIGCALTGCCYGMKYDGIGAIIYENSVAAPINVKLFPIQFVEACTDLLIAGLLIIFLHYTKGKKWAEFSISLYLICYSVIRFFLEFFRGDDLERGQMMGWSVSQWISIGILAGVAFYEVRRSVLSAN